ncbi:BN159_2729 family protein [Streptomyces spinosisporus]|uniref:BN159_2729 family protein n=1 Tax=Streptomyces spinosisporus TaxID=2927582 RepID=A0ABS9XH51_9ACTN|nr:BN159_2729 family protein [Streptomyces spinosisporus]MCI3240237.1 BN159_2729 family protein [Streptomyces spinosisporus]
MNKNFPHALKVVRQAIASSGHHDLAAAIVHGLNSAGLLVDPERSYGMLLTRAPAGGWAKAVDDTVTPTEGPREHQAHVEPPAAGPAPETQRTELEQQAAAWDEACGRARQVAAQIRRHIGEHRSFQNVQLDGDRVLVALHIVDQGEWVQWRRYFGITHDKETALPYMVAGDGYRDGIRVSVVAYDLPEARKHALSIAKEPFEFEGVVYDLALPQQDGDGDEWFYQGVRTADGMPLLSLDGRPERCSLANIVRMRGPLTPVPNAPTPQAAPVTTGAEGGERA